MAIVIKKRVDLDFLGDDYKEAYFVFKSIPAIDFDDVTAELNKIEKSGSGQVRYLIDLLKKYFISGSFPGDDGTLAEVTSDDLEGLDADTLIKCFQLFTGQEPDPKAETPLTSSSPTVESPPESL